ncbi:MAG: hypothetical protein GF333_00505 [Candidatus Omnitrophica bacterium]|nr:hypothetical protein [Candidatus Omnitrophota bacterium]
MKKPQRKNERRDFPRIKVNFIITYRINGSDGADDSQKEALPGLMEDLSEAGLAVLTKHKTSPLTPVTVEFMIYDYTSRDKDARVKVLRVDGEVRYVVPTGSSGYRMGVCFHQLDAKDRKLIRAFVTRMSK